MRPTHRTHIRRLTTAGLAGAFVLVLGSTIGHSASEGTSDASVPGTARERLAAARAAVDLAGAGKSPSPDALRDVPAPEQDPCLHCHIGGEETGLWAPLARWTVFGISGTVFAFGLYRSASVWRSRARWVPLRARVYGWLDDRYELTGLLEKVLRKPVPRYATHWWYCLGGITAFLFLVQVVTGMMLAFYYKPTPEAAYASIEYIEREVRFGAAVRAVHHWAANGMVVMCLAHMARVFITGSYRPPRELNWVAGVVLLLLTLAFGFTGYLLPWDQRAFWATTVGTEIAGSLPVVGELALVFLRGGWTVASETLSRFYALHVFVLPLATFAFMGLHFLMVRRQGIARPL
jgi:hypothetical protein